MNRIKYFAQAEQVIEAWWATFVECANPACMDTWVSTKHQEDGDPGLKSFILLLKQYDQSGLSFVEMPPSNY